MGNIMQTRYGQGIPTSDNLANYELGYSRTTESLYINDNGTVKEFLEKNKVASSVQIESLDTRINGVESDIGVLEVSVEEKAAKPASSTLDNIALLTANGDLKDSGKKWADVDKKADKVLSAVNNNFASLDASGNIKNSGTSIADMLNRVYPVGAIYMSVVNTSPATLFGGTWVAWGSGRVPVGINTGDSNFNTVEKTGGSSTHTLISSELPSHYHSYEGYIINPNGSWPGGYDKLVIYGQPAGTTVYTFGTGLVGNNQPHNNLQPYITCYMWKRTA